MTPAEQRLYSRVQRRAAEVSPELAAALLRAWQRLRDEIPVTVLAQAIATNPEGVFDRILTQAVFDVAFLPVRERLRQSIRVSVPVYTKTLPPKLTGQIAFGFDVLSPHVVEAIRALESRVIGQLQTEVREVVRSAVQDALVAGKSSRVAAQAIRDAIGLGPSQLAEVDNYRVKLQHAHERLDALDNQLRDRRYDGVVRTARKTGEPIPPEKIDRMVEAYRKRRLAQNAATNAGTAAKDAQRLANRLAWEHAVNIGAVDRSRLYKQRIGVNDDRERPEHVAINDQVRHFDEPYSNGEMVSGDSSYGCRCVDRIFVRAA